MVEAGVFNSNVTVDYSKEDRRPNASNSRRKSIHKEAMLALELNLDYQPTVLRHRRLLMTIKALLGMVNSSRAIQHSLMADMQAFAIKEAAEYVHHIHKNFVWLKTEKPLEMSVSYLLKPLLTLYLVGVGDELNIGSNWHYPIKVHFGKVLEFNVVCACDLNQERASLKKFDLDDWERVVSHFALFQKWSL